MSRELIGNYGTIVGSVHYFEQLNRENFFGNLMRQPQSTAYDNCLQDVTSRIQDTVQEIYEDLRKHIGIIRHIPKNARENLIKVLLGLTDICKMASTSNGRSDECVSILSLSDYDTYPQSRADDREIEEAAEIVRNGNFLTRSDRMDVIRQAMDWGDRSVSGDLEKTIFLQAVSQGHSREFLGDVWLKLLYADDPRQFTGRCGRVICSEEYIDHIEKHVFQTDIPNYYGGRNGDRAYARLITSSLENIAKTIEQDLEQGIRDNDYLQDENADRLREALNALERCDVRCYSLESKVDELAWFVGGDAEKIRQLQGKLNELSVGEQLKEDGVYGKKTEKAVAEFMQQLLHGSVPTLTWADPLQSSFSSVYSKKIPNTNVSALWDFSQRSANPNKGIVVFRVDEPHGSFNYRHINTVEGRSIKSGKYNPSEFQRANLNALNHTEISDDAYRVLKDFDGVAKKVRVAGKILLVAGAVLDALELYQTIEGDLHDADRKIGKKTYSAVAGIGGSWGLGALGAKGGAAAGAAIGTAIMPGVGTAIGGAVGGLVLGIAGSYGGDALGRWVVDITVTE